MQNSKPEEFVSAMGDKYTDVPEVTSSIEKKTTDDYGEAIDGQEQVTTSHFEKELQMSGMSMTHLELNGIEHTPQQWLVHVAKFCKTLIS